LVLWFVGIILSLAGYVPDQVQSAEAIFSIRLLYAEGPAIFLVLSIILAYLLPMNRQRHRALKEAIRLKKEGKEWDNNAIEKLL
jgi:Na+/melibiose symporter-like transporter